MEPAPKRRMPVNGHGTPAPVRHPGMAPAVEGHDGAVDVDVPRDRQEEWNGLISMMTVIHSMVEKVYQAACMLRETDMQDRNQWLLYAQRQREEAEAAASGHASRIINTAMDDAQDVIQRQPGYGNGGGGNGGAAMPVQGGPPGHHAHIPEARVVPTAAPQPAAAPAHADTRGAAVAVGTATPTAPPASADPQSGGVAPPNAEDEEVCWNCGREATETCSRCKKARYCGVWCQRRDWKMKHHRVCREPNSDEPIEPGTVAPSKEQPAPVEDRPRAQPQAEERVEPHHGGDQSQQQQQQPQQQRAAGSATEQVVYVADPTAS